MALHFDIRLPVQKIRKAVQTKLAQKAGKATSFGKLEEVATRLALIQQSVSPQLQDPVLLIFAGDHGIGAHTDVFFPFEETTQTISRILQADAAVNAFSREAGMRLRIVDAGVSDALENHIDYWLNRGSRLIPRKIQAGTRNFLHEAAMTSHECHAAIASGAAIVDQEFYRGSNVIGLGDLGKANTASAHLITAALLNIAPESLVEHKQTAKILKRTFNRHPNTRDPITILCLYGGYEMAMLCGAILQASQRQMTIIMDGYVPAVSFLLAWKMHPEAASYCFFADKTDEKGFEHIMSATKQNPLFSIGMNKGEGGGVALTYPFFKNAQSLLNDEGF